MKPAALWPAAVIGALVVTVAANVVLLMAANDPRHAVVEPGYYRKAIAWDSTMAQEGRNEALGWTVAANLESTPGGAVLRARLADRAALPLSGARVTVEGIHNLDSGTRVRGELRETSAGRYEATLPLRRRGLWELRFTVNRLGERFTADLRQDLDRRP
jgi:nitrogen fixation protein FixH